jgi:hypothetical protein
MLILLGTVFYIVGTVLFNPLFYSVIEMSEFLELQVVTFGTSAFVHARCDTLHCMQLSHISERERDSRICIR